MFIQRSKTFISTLRRKSSDAASPPIHQGMDLTRNVSIQAAAARLKRHRLEISDFISLGAGSGSDTVWLHQQLCPNSHLLMVEAQALHKENLEKAKRKNDKVDYLICAAAAEDGEVHFNSSSATGGAISSQVTTQTIAVPARSIDSLMAERQRSGPYFLKFDTHGVELDIFAGAQKALQNTSLVMVEAYNFRLNFVDGKNLLFYEMCSYLAQYRLRCVDMCEPLFRPNDTALWQVHLFFIRDDHPVFSSNSHSAPFPFKD